MYKKNQRNLKLLQWSVAGWSLLLLALMQVGIIFKISDLQYIDRIDWSSNCIMPPMSLIYYRRTITMTIVWRRPIAKDLVNDEIINISGKVIQDSSGKCQVNDWISSCSDSIKIWNKVVTLKLFVKAALVVIGICRTLLSRLEWNIIINKLNCKLMCKYIMW